MLKLYPRTKLLIVYKLAFGFIFIKLLKVNTLSFASVKIVGFVIRNVIGVLVPIVVVVDIFVVVVVVVVVVVPAAAVLLIVPVIPVVATIALQRGDLLAVIEVFFIKF